jgi:TolA-binding protein
MRRVQWLLLLAMVLVLAVPVAAQSARPSGALAEGIAFYQAGRYEQAIAALGALARSKDDPQKPAAVFWLAKAQLALGRLDDASVNLDAYLAGWPQAADRAEAVYLSGRVQHQQEDFEAAIRTFQSFLTVYPASPLAGNAWFWSAECLYGLGRLEEAAVLYQKVIREYPTSAKIEAAQYKASLIGLTQRERELTRLLKWSHEEFLRTIEEYQRRQDVADLAIASLQKRLAAGGQSAVVATAQAATATPTSTAAAEKALADLRAELDAKTAEAKTLAGRATDLETQLEALKASQTDTQAGTAESAAVYDQALADLRTELAAKAAEVAALQAQADDLALQLSAANDAAAAADEIARAATEAARAATAASEAAAAKAAETARLLAAKAEALALKEQLLGWLQEQGGTP